MGKKCWHLKQKAKRLDKNGIKSLEKADGVVVVMDHQKCLTAAAVQTNCVSAFLPLKRNTSNYNAKNTHLFHLTGFFSWSLAIINDHRVINYLRKPNNMKFSDY